MKIRLDVNLKTASGSIINAGTVFSDPIPDFIMNRVARRQATIIVNDPVKAVKKEVEEENKSEEVPEPIKKVLKGKGKIVKK